MKKLIIIPFLFLSIVINSQEIKFGKVSKEELTEKTHPIDSTAEAAYLYKKRRTFFEYDSNNGFIIVTEIHDRIKVYTKEGFKYAVKKINYYKPDSGDQEKVTNLKAYTFNIEDGKIVKQKVSRKNIFDEKLSKYRSQKKITFPKIKEGSIIDLKYKIISPSRSIKTLNFQYNIPVKQLYCKVEIPEYYIYNKRNKGYYAIPFKETFASKSIRLTNKREVRSTGTTSSNFSTNRVDYRSSIYTFTKTDIPAIKDNEPYVNNIENYRGGMEFELSGTRFPNSRYKNFSTSWEDVSKRIYKSTSFGDQIEKDRYFRDDLTMILKDAKNDTDKITLIFNHVKNKVKWNDYYGKYTEKGVKKAYKDGTGNVAEINLMLTGMLRSIGFDANPVLVSTRFNGTPLFPTFKGFNYVISKINFPDQSYILLDASEKYSTPNTLPIRCLNWNGREIHKNGTSNWVSLIPKKHAKETNTLHIKINDDFSINGMLRTVYTDHVAMLYRDKNNIKKEEDVITALEDKHTIEIEDFKSLNKTALSKNIVQSFKFEGDDFVEGINEKIYITPLFFLTQKENPFKSNERNFPVDFGLPWQDKHTVSINIPEGYIMQSIPEPLAIGLPENLGVFKFQVMHKGNKIKVMSVLQINSNIISPQYYSILKDFYKQLVSKQNEKIVLIKK
ncbi:hypothetical protein DS884_08280 [Tenacibaculum sp. E3R01]|uniref:DUF3857 domain-containing protein n=1 Tax=Tenacibaculum sp. E3R01 TaxID=2267227 RepID=UPI000DE8BCE1|nr:DUF3857 domain-containing protein [Tenacibaculum sp. E3R01]RBW59722.1 hypothetical protein DS884_08280 [Tenacibaculum sp. E3R01]